MHKSRLVPLTDNVIQAGIAALTDAQASDMPPADMVTAIFRRMRSAQAKQSQMGDPELPSRVLAILADAAEAGTVAPSIPALSELVGASPSRVRSAIEILRDRGDVTYDEIENKTIRTYTVNGKTTRPGQKYPNVGNMTEDDISKLFNGQRYEDDPRAVTDTGSGGKWNSMGGRVL